MVDTNKERDRDLHSIPRERACERERETERQTELPSLATKLFAEKEALQEKHSGLTASAAKVVLPNHAGVPRPSKPPPRRTLQ